MKAKDKKRNEAVYNFMQENEIPMFFDLMPGIVKNVLYIDSLWEGVGRPPLKLYDVLICLLVKEYFQLSLRRSIGMLKLLKSAKIIDIETVPSFKTLSNYLNKPEIQKILQDLIAVTSAIFAEVETHMATDSTGISTLTRSSWYEIRVCKKSERKDHLIVHTTVGTESNVVAAIDIRIKQGEDNIIFRNHVKRVKNLFRNIKDWSGDSMYLARENCNAVAEIGANPWFRLKSNTTAKAKGSPAWKKMVNTMREKPEIAEPKYHKRSNVESTFSAKKRKFNRYVRATNNIAKINEETLAWVCYNFSIITKAYVYNIHHQIEK